MPKQQPITLVTGNTGKLSEWQRLFPSDFNLDTIDIDLAEIQSLDLGAIVADKARRAFAILQQPVVVEDVSAGLDVLGGLPGPFIKFFEKRIGQDALFQLAQAEGAAATVVCSVAYFDGNDMLLASGTVTGTVCSSRGEYGFGFDHNFVPNGQSKSYGEMAPAEKDTVSHRSIAVHELVTQLRTRLQND